MTTPTRGTMPPAMSPDRWRMIDAILQAALACEPARRAALVDSACGSDVALRTEVESLLAAHLDAPEDYLLRPAAEPLRPMLREMIPPESPFDATRQIVAPPALEAGGPPATTGGVDVAPSGRKVSASAALYAALLMLVVGLAGGMFIDPSALVRRWTSEAPAAVPAAASPGMPPVTASSSDLTLAVVDRAGRPVRTIDMNRPWTPRFSPDGRRIAYGAFGPGRESSDLWITDLGSGVTRRLTDAFDDANDPQWSRDGSAIAYSANAPAGKDVMMRSLDGAKEVVLATRTGTQFPSDWLRDGTLLVTDQAGPDRHDILIQPKDGSVARPYATTPADETAARVSPDERWVAYTSDESGRAEVYLDSYPRPGHRVKISSNGGEHPVWRGDGRELFYWRDGALVAVQLEVARGDDAPTPDRETVLFRAPYQSGLNTMYDVSPDGQRFVLVRQR